MTPTNTTPIKIVLVGGSGYAGFEVLRWLTRHPNAEVVGVFGPESELGPMEEFYPHLSKQVTLAQELFTVDAVKALDADLAMLCVPHKVAMSYVPALRDAGLRVIDWSADYRIKSQAVYEQWYCPHTDAGRLAEAAYGLPEWFADEVRSAELVANPGCYPTCAALALAPAIKNGLIEPGGIVVNAISGVSGAGRKPGLKFHFPERNENFEAYAPGVHRHMPEMEQTLSTIAGKDVDLLFVPHLSPMDRGMLCSIYATPTPDGSADAINRALHDAYDDAPFVRVRDEVLPATKYVVDTNFCDVGVRVEKGRVILMSALDNLLKGASTQAIQNMNLMFDLPETTGLY